jgi:hypothetical protein
LDAVNHAYRQIEAMNFSKRLLENFSVVHTSRLMVVAVRDVYWSDWGSERRIMSVLQNKGGSQWSRLKPVTQGPEKSRLRKLPSLA